MKINEILREDDYYPRETDFSKTEEELQQFIESYIEEHLGAPHGGGAQRDMGVIINIPRKDPRSGAAYKPYPGWQDDWKETAKDLIDELRRNDFGDYVLDRFTPTYMELEKARINETTSAGGMATVVSPLNANSALTRGASIYGNKKPGPRKKKKAGKYANSKQDK